MGVTSFSYDFDCPVPPARMFKALILDSHNLFPKLMPQAIKRVEFVQGDGGAGSIKQTNFAEGARFKCMKERIDAIDKENFACKYTIIEGDMLNDKSVESISYEVKFEASVDGGGCVCKMRSEYHTVGGFGFKEEEIKAKKVKAMALYKAVEAYLLENPDAYH